MPYRGRGREEEGGESFVSRVGEKQRMKRASDSFVHCHAIAKMMTALQSCLFLSHYTIHTVTANLHTRCNHHDSGCHGNSYSDSDV